MSAFANRRRSVIVNWREQKRFILALGIPTMVMLVTLGIYAVWLNGKAFDSEAPLTGDEPLLSLFSYYGLGVVALVVTAEVAVLLAALRTSHRYEGPAHRLVLSMQRMRQGDLDFTVKLREHDHLQHVAAELNSLIDWLRPRLPAEPATAPAAAAMPAVAGEHTPPGERQEVASTRSGA